MRDRRHEPSVDLRYGARCEPSRRPINIWEGYGNLSGVRPHTKRYRYAQSAPQITEEGMCSFDSRDHFAEPTNNAGMKDEKTHENAVILVGSLEPVTARQFVSCLGWIVRKLVNYRFRSLRSFCDKHLIKSSAESVALIDSTEPTASYLYSNQVSIRIAVGTEGRQRKPKCRSPKSFRFDAALS